MGFFENEGWINFSMYLSYFLVFAGVAIMIGFFVWHAIQHPKGAIQPVAAVVGLLIVFGICYAMASDAAFLNVAGEVLVEGSGSKAVGGGLITSYLMIFAAIGALIYSEVTTFIKNR